VIFSASPWTSPLSCFESAAGSSFDISSIFVVGVTSDSDRFIGTIGIGGNVENDVEGVAAGVTPEDEVECISGTEC